MSQVTEHLDTRGVSYEVLHRQPDSEPSAPDGEPSEQVRTVVLDLRTGHAFAVVPQNRHVDLAAVRTALSSTHVVLASDETIARDYPEFDGGEVAPLGSLLHTPLIVDPQVFQHDTVVFPTGSGDELVRMAARDLFDTAQMRVAVICHSLAPA